MRPSNRVRRAIAASALALLSSSASAQFGLGPGLMDQTDRDWRDRDKQEKEAKKKQEREKKENLPFAAALADALPPSDWAAMKVSTSTTKQELSRLLRSGLYRLELVTLVLAADKAGRPLAKLVDQRQQAETLRSIVEGLKLDYGALYDQAATLKVQLDRRATLIEAESPRGPRPAEGVSTSSAAAVSLSSAAAVSLSSAAAVSLSSAPAVPLSSAPAVSTAASGALR